ncbi:NAD(P)H-dependent flavin oxidoreductase [Corynebacterium sp. Marseille-Q2516]
MSPAPAPPACPRVPIIAAPMAGGPSTPELVCAVGQAGGLGFLASGASDAATLDDQMRTVADGGGPYGVNLFCPQNPDPERECIGEVAQELQPLFAQHGLEWPGIPDVDYMFGWNAKFNAILDAVRAGYGPTVVSCTFGIFAPNEFDCLRAYGVEAWVTVTNPQDARVAADAGARALIVQGPEAGGHRSTWSVCATPDERPLEQLLIDVHAVTDAPLIAAGGLTTPGAVARVLAQDGVCAAACGTAFLRAPEAGTSQRNRRLLSDATAEALRTVSTRAFSGRFARGLPTAFTQAHPDLKPCYPHLGALMAPLRGRDEFAYCLCGAEYASAPETPAGEIVSWLASELET